MAIVHALASNGTYSSNLTVDDPEALTSDFNSGDTTITTSASSNNGYVSISEYQVDGIPGISKIDPNNSYLYIILLPGYQIGISVTDSYGNIVGTGQITALGPIDGQWPSGWTASKNNNWWQVSIPCSVLQMTSNTTINDFNAGNYSVTLEMWTSTSSSYMTYFSGAVFYLAYEIPKFKVYTTLKGEGSTNRDFKTEIEYGTEDELLIYPPDEESLHTVTVLKDGVDVSSSVAPMQRPEAYMEYPFNEIYDPNNELANLNNSTWFSAIATNQTTWDTDNLTDNNYYSNSSSADVTFYYRCNVALGFTVTPPYDYLYLKVNGHAENPWASNEKMSVQLIFSPYYDLNLDGSEGSEPNLVSEVYNFSDSGAFNRVQEIRIPDDQATGGMYYAAVKVTVGYYGGALNGLSWGVRAGYYNPSWAQYGNYPGQYSYKYTVEADTKFEVFVDETPSGSRNRVNATVVQGNLLGTVDPTQFDLYQGSSYKLYLALNDPTYKFWVRKRVNGGAIVDVTNQLVTVRAPEKHTSRFDLGTYTVVSGTMPSDAGTWFSSRVGKGYDTTDTTTTNYRTTSTSSSVYFTYAFDDSQLLQMPDEFIITNAYIRINGHAQSMSNTYEYMVADPKFQNSYVSSSLNFKSYGTSNVTVKLNIWPTPTIQELKTGKLNLRCRLGYYGGAINGATLFIEYEDPRPAYLLRTGEYTYEETNEGNTQLDIYMLEMEKLWVKQNGTWTQATSSTYHHDPSDTAVMNTGVYVKDSNWVDHEQEHIYPVFFNKAVKKETT